jgi:hypothetical protein
MAIAFLFLSGDAEAAACTARCSSAKFMSDGAWAVAAASQAQPE